jgi:hypothetical protein
MSLSTGVVTTGPIELLIDPIVHHKAAPRPLIADRIHATPGLFQMPVKRLLLVAPTMYNSTLSLSPVNR